MIRRRWVLLYLVLLFGPLGLKGQAFFNPRVSINTYGLQQTAQKDVEKLQEQLQLMLESYRPEVKLSYTPKHPIRIAVYLHVQEAIGDQYKGEMEVALYRPVYGDNREELLVFFSDKSLAFRYRSDEVYDFISGGLPESMLARIIYYYATLGAMYYYDSFELKGGEPFLMFLNDNMQYFSTAWSRLGGAFSTVRAEVSRYAPMIFLQELKTEGGEKFRELWYIYHRRGVDSTTPYGYAETISAVLKELVKLRDIDNSLPFIPLFYAAKSGAISRYIHASELPMADEISRLAENLFPTFSIAK